MNSGQQAHSYAQYLTSCLHISPTVARTNMKTMIDCIKFVSFASLEFGSHVLYKAQVVLMDSF